MDNTWIMKLQSIVLTRLKNQFSSDLLTDLSMTKKNFSTVQNSASKPIFPYVYVKQYGLPEILQSIEGNSINGVNFTLQIDVIDNQSQNRSNKVMSEVISIMKDMSFQVKSFPSFDENIDEYRTTVTFQRYVGASDNL